MCFEELVVFEQMFQSFLSQLTHFAADLEHVISLMHLRQLKAQRQHWQNESHSSRHVWHNVWCAYIFLPRLLFCYNNYLIPGYTSIPICLLFSFFMRDAPTSTAQPHLISSLHARGEEIPPNRMFPLPGPNFPSQSHLSTSFLTGITENQSK